MKSNRFAVTVAFATFITALLAGRGMEVAARQAAPEPAGTRASLNGLLSSTLVFGAADADKDGVITRAELQAAVGKWFGAADAAHAGAVTREQLATALDTAMPRSGLAAAFNACEL